MRPGAKMLMISNRRNDQDNNRDARSEVRSNDNGQRGGSGGRNDMDNIGYSRTEMNGARMDWGPEDRFRDRRGREHYDNGRFAPRNDMDEMEDNYGPESRRRYYPRSDGAEMRANDDRGENMRYGESRGNYGGESRYPFGPVPPIYERGDRMNRIGFSIDREVGGDYRTDAAYSHMNEMEHRTSSPVHGGAKSHSTELTREMAEEWMKNLRNEDGSKGPHWTLEQIKQVIAQRGIDCDPVKLWVAMNAEYSDRSEVNKKHKVNTIDFYLDSAIASWLNDKDAKGDKEAAYFRYIVMPDA